MGFDLAGLARQVAGLVRLGAFDTSTDAGRSRERYRRVGLTFLATVAGRGAAAIASLVAVPVMLRYLGAERYGLWAVISSAGMALLFADLGIGNGLLSVLAEDAGRDDRAAARRHVSSAFLALLLVALALGGVFALAYPHVTWSGLLRASSATAARESGPAVAAFLVCFLASMPLGIVTRVRLAHQEGFANSAWSAAGSFVGLGFLVMGIRAGASLPWLVLGLCAGPVLALLAQSMVLFTVQQPWLRPRWGAASGEAAWRILRLGFAFSVLQLAGAAATASDALVAGMVLGPVEAAHFAVVAAVFELPLSLLIMLLTPMWPAYGEALARQDVAWMKKALRRSVLLATVFGATVGLGLLLVGRPLIRVWVGEEMVPSFALLGWMAARLLVLAVGQALAVFLNGARLIRLQLAFGPVMAAAAIALKVWGGNSLGLTGLVAGGVAAQVLLGLIPYGLAVRRWPGGTWGFGGGGPKGR
jgi:O-antigen/teichoic acid export membrane protein